MVVLLPAEAKTRKSSHPAPTKVSAAGKRSKTAKASAKTTRTRTTSAVAAKRPSGPARQTSPTTERYMEIQGALAAKGYYSGEATGLWDAESVQALKRFQQDQGLKPDGKLGALSLIALGLGPKREPMGELAAKPELPASLAPDDLR